MSREINLKMTTREVEDKLGTAGIGVSAIEALPAGGTRLVCMSSDGAERVRKLLKSKLIAGEVKRAKRRPARPLW